jgi:protein-disulfide isomerase
MTEATPNKNKIVVGVVAIILLLILIGAGFLWSQQQRQRSVAINKIISQTPAGNKTNAVTDSQTVARVRSLDQSDHVLGGLQSPVQLIFYGDFDCPFCASFYDTLKKVDIEFKNKVAIGFRYYPLRTHNMALPAALAAECAAEQGKFWEMYNKLFVDKQENKMNLDQFASDATAISLDTDKFKDCLDTERYKDKIQSQWQEAGTFNVIGTPGIFINGEQLSGAIPWEDYKDQNGKTQEGLKSIISRILQGK